jgi:hypothetical protein
MAVVVVMTTPAWAEKKTVVISALMLFLVAFLARRTRRLG